METRQKGIPILETTRLRLRPYQQDDVDDVHRLLIDPAVRRYLCDDKIIPRDAVQAMVEQSIAEAERSGLGAWTIRPRGHDHAIGVCGLKPVETNGQAEVLYALHPDWWKRGLATEAVRAVLDYAFGAAGIELVVANTDVPNVDSVRTLERLGFGFHRRATVNGLELLFYSLPRPNPARRDHAGY